jgi:hypothetical protein
MNAEQFKQVTGKEPEQDDLERVNCSEAGLDGHYQCGLCGFCGYPRCIVNVNCDHRTSQVSRKEGR